MYGTGSQITAIIQIRDRFLDRKFWHQSAVHGQFSAVHKHLSFVETVFNQMQDVGVKRTFNQFFSTVQDLNASAHLPTYRTNVITNAHTLTEQIRQNAFSLQRQQKDLNREFADVIVTINSLGSQISDLNRQIHIFERNGDNANDLRDQRALLIDRLSELVNVEVEERDFSRPGVSYDRRLTVMINGYDFVDHTRINRLQLVARDNPDDTRAGTKRNEMDVHGLYEVFFEMSGSRFDIHSRTLSGQLRGIVDVRDGNGGQLTADYERTGMSMIQNQLLALERSSAFFNSLNSQFVTWTGDLGIWVTARDTNLALLGGASDTAEARAYLTNLVNIRNERANLNTSLPALRNGFVTGIGMAGLRNAVSGAGVDLTLPANAGVVTALNNIQGHLNGISSINNPSDLDDFIDDLDDLLDALELTNPALASLPAITSLRSNINDIAAPLNTALTRLHVIEFGDATATPPEPAYGTEAVLDARITAAQTAMNALNDAIRRINDVVTFGNRIESQMEWAIGNTIDMINLVRARITELENETNRIPGVIAEYEDFLAVLEAQLGDELSPAPGTMRAMAAAVVLPPSDGVYSTLAELTTLVARLNDVVDTGAVTGFPQSIQEIIDEANNLLSAGESINRGATTNFKGIPFYMNQLNHLVRTFARAMNEGRNVNGEQIVGMVNGERVSATGHIFGFDANGENRNALFFTMEHPTSGDAGVLVDDDPFLSLRLWIMADPADATGRTPLRDANGHLITEQGPNPPVDAAGNSLVARDDMGRPMFTIDYSRFNALNFIVNPELDDPDLFAASSNHNIGQANNDIVHGFLAVNSDTSLFREGKLIDFIIATSSHLGVDTKQAGMFRESYHEITLQTHNHRLSVKSVDTEEEMMNLIRFQNMFIATSKLINVLDTVYDTLINRLGNF
jgi:flagellar hook-associated protein FlgK